MGSSLRFSGSRSPGFPYCSLMRSIPCHQTNVSVGRRFAKHLPRNNRVQPLQRVARHSIFSRAEQIGLTKTLIEDEGTIEYEA